MGFKRTTDGRVFFQGTNETANDGPLGLAQKPQQALPQPSSTQNSKTQMQVLSLLKSLNDRLKTTQAERDFMRKQLEDYRGLIDKLEEKSGQSEQAQAELKKQIEALNTKETITGKPDGRTEEFIRDTLKEMEKTRRLLLTLESKTDRADQSVSHIKQSQQVHAQKLAKTGSEFTKITTRLSEHEERQNLLNERIDDAISRQEKLTDKVEKAIEERERFMRKIERIEETVLQTRDALNARAVLFSQDASEGKPAISADQALGQALLTQNQPLENTKVFDEKTLKGAAMEGSISFPMRMKLLGNTVLSKLNNQAVLVPGVFFLAIIGGAYIGSMQMEKAEPIALEKSTTEANESASTDWSIEEDTSAFSTGETSIAVETPTPPTTPLETNDTKAGVEEETPLAHDAPKAPKNTSELPNYLQEQGLESQEQMTKMMEEAPAELASKMNNIEPGHPTESETAETAAESEAAPVPQAPVVETPAAPKTDISETQIAPSTSTKAEISSDPNLPSVIKQVEKQAMAGSPEAQHDLAAIYIAGHAGVEQNYERAVYWFRKAAEKGVANARYNLGVLNHQGLGVKANLDEAIYWYKQAAEKNHAEAQYNLGIAYIEGIGVPYLPQKAADYFEQAANNGVIEAAYNLGLIYENGLLGTPKPDVALMWYKHAADQGSPEAQTALELLARSSNIPLDQVNKLADSVKNGNGGIDSSAPAKSIKAQNNAMAATYGLSKEDTLAAVEKEFEQILITETQQELMKIGLYPGPADGVIGPKTRDAVMSYQKANSLDATGDISANLLDHMLQQAGEDN